MSVLKKIFDNNVAYFIFFFFIFASFIDYVNPALSYSHRPICITLYAMNLYSFLDFNKIKLTKLKLHETLIITCIICCNISSILNVNFLGYDKYFKEFYYAIFIFLSLRCFLRRLSVKQIEYSIVMGSSLGAFISLIAYICYFDSYNIDQIGAFDGYRLTGFIGKDPNYAMTNFVLFISYCLSNNCKKYKIGFFLASLCLIFSMSRGSFIAIFFSLFFYFFLSRNKLFFLKRILKVSSILVLLASMFLLIAYSFQNLDFIFNRFTVSSISSGGDRLLLWQWAIQTIKENYIYGIGWGNTRFYNKIHNNWGLVNHNTYLDFFVEGGLFVGCLYLIFNIWILYRLLIISYDHKSLGINFNYLILSHIMLAIMFCFVSGGFLRPSYVIFLAILERYMELDYKDLEVDFNEFSK